MGLTGYGNGLCLVDGKGEPTCNRIVSTDSRAAEYCRRFAESGAERAIYPMTCQTIWSAQPAALLPWFKDVMLVMPFGVLDIQDTPFKIYVSPGEQSGLVCTDPAAVKELEENRNRHFPYNRFFPVVDNGDMVTLLEKTAEFFRCKSMGDISSPFFPGNLRGLHSGQAAAVQKANEAIHHINPRQIGRAHV